MTGPQAVSVGDVFGVAGVIGSFFTVKCFKINMRIWLNFTGGLATLITAATERG